MKWSSYIDWLLSKGGTLTKIYYNKVKVPPQRQLLGWIYRDLSIEIINWIINMLPGMLLWYVLVCSVVSSVSVWKNCWWKCICIFIDFHRKYIELKIYIFYCYLLRSHNYGSYHWFTQENGRNKLYGEFSNSTKEVISIKFNKTSISQNS